MNQDLCIRLGKLIELYRSELEKKEGSDKWGIEQFLHTPKKYQNICSRTTYFRLRKGKKVNEHSYYELIKKLGYNFKEFQLIDKELDFLYQKLYRAVFYMDIGALGNIKMEIQFLFKEAKNYFFYVDIYKLLMFIVLIHIDSPSILDDDEVKHLGFVSTLLGGANYNLFIYSLFSYEINYTKNYDNLNRLFESLDDFEKYDDPLILLCLVYKYNSNIELEKGNATIKKIKKLVPTNNICFLFRVKLRELFYTYNFNASNSDNAYNEVLEYSNEHPNIPVYMLKIFHYNYAMHLLSNNRLEKAIEVFEVYFALDESFNVFAESMYAMCKTMLFQMNLRCVEIGKLELNNIWSCILKYCILKQKKCKTEELFIILENEVIPNTFNDLPPVVINFIRKEVLEISSIMKRYKIVSDMDFQLLK